jgi:hypothetical protein
MKFFTNQLSTPSIIPLIHNENDFQFIRDYLLNKPTITEYQIASRIAKTIDLNNKDIVDDLLVKTRLGKNMKWINNLIIHCTHEQRLQGSK